MTGKVEELLISERKNSPLLFVLIDSEVSQIDSAVKLAKDVEEIGAASILVGGSSATDQMEMARGSKKPQKCCKYPNHPISRQHYWRLYLRPMQFCLVRLMNSENPYYITQAQALGAPNVLKFGLEPLPTSYLVIGEGTSAWFVGNVRGIPFDKPKIAAAYSLAAQFFGMRFVYLEAGSGAKTNVTPEMGCNCEKGLSRDF